MLATPNEPIPQLTLVFFAEEHFATLSSWFQSQKDVVQWGGPGLLYPLDSTQMAPMAIENAKASCWMVEDESGKMIGHVQLAFDWPNGVAKLCRVAMAPSERGKGLARHMVREAVARAFSHPQIERVELNVYSWNVAAIRAYVRQNFVKEGVRRSSVLIDGERWDTVMMAMLRQEWDGADAT
ncbi:GNAT family N-acetyltransferase [Acetobacter sacchari]|uniref:GNAT family N-acetyltransferase n=1 Tax=Acetobacter sacchari TaxID=2661687 RepID=A0ABS3LZD6_9PROT|nr:GNAT family protein [Acetobacter sacchari]MBO1361285.1 GNAT family N-acetyltransferase [Acetobacter sacchari]